MTILHPLFIHTKIINGTECYAVVEGVDPGKPWCICTTKEQATIIGELLEEKRVNDKFFSAPYLKREHEKTPFQVCWNCIQHEVCVRRKKCWGSP